MRMEEQGPHAVGDTVLYRSDEDHSLIIRGEVCAVHVVRRYVIRGKVCAVHVVRRYEVIPEGTLGIVDTVEEAPFA